MTISSTLVLFVTLPLVASTLVKSSTSGVEADVSIVIWEVPAPVIDGGLKPAVELRGSLFAARTMGELNPPAVNVAIV